MLDIRGQIGEDNFDRLMKGMALGQYNGLFGAGFSADSMDRTGARMPIGTDLRDEIAAEFDISDFQNKSLKRVYALAQGQTSSTGRTLQAFIKDRFTQTKPAHWLQDLLRIQWDTLWTLNVDDCLEVAFNQIGPASRQKLRSISWTDPHSQADKRRDEVLLVHLHGKASRSQKQNELIFDISGYTNSLLEQHRWLKIFGDDYPAKPFVVIGASIDEEIDLQDIFDEGRPVSPEYPSLIVLKSIDAFQAREYEKYGLIPVEATGKDFIDLLTGELPNYLAQLTDDEVGVTDATPRESIRFLDQWRRLNRKPEPLKPAGHDLYLGHEPAWFDATTDRLSKRPVVRRTVEKIEKLQASNESGVLLLSGEAFSGKSGVLLRVALELGDRTFRPWLFTGDQALDVEAALHWLMREPKAVLLIDNASDFARDVHNLLATAKERKVPVRMLLVERARRVKHVAELLVTDNFDGIVIQENLSDTEIASLVQTLGAKRRLGALTNMTPGERKAYFAGHGGKLFSAMAALEDGRGFKQRVTEELAKASSRPHRALLSAVALASRLGYPLPLELAKTSANMTAAEAQRLVLGDLSDLLEMRAGGITTRHRLFGELLIQELPKEESKAAVIRLALAVAPYVSPQAIRASTIYYRIARGLMGAELQGDLFGTDHATILDVYANIQEAYDWNARYWDQRALAAAEANLHEKAYSWVEQAIDRKRDALSLTTAGKVLMLRALYEARPDLWPTASFEKAEDFLSAARKMEGAQAEYPIETFLTYLARLVHAVPNRDRVLNEQIRLLWNLWFNAILDLEEGSRIRLDRVRRDSIVEWEKAGFGK